MTLLIDKPLVHQELHALYTGPLRDALRKSDLRYRYGSANTGTGNEFDDMVFDDGTMTALVEVLSDDETGTGRVVAYGRGREIVFNALSEFTEEFGAPAAFVVELSHLPEPICYSDGSTKILR